MKEPVLGKFLGAEGFDLYQASRKKLKEYVLRLLDSPRVELPKYNAVDTLFTI